jgi:hypothetical protein
VPALGEDAGVAVPTAAPTAAPAAAPAAATSAAASVAATASAPVPPAAAAAASGAPSTTPSERKRDAFVQRMQRKALREGKPGDFHLRVGLAPPTAADVARVAALQGKERMQLWFKQFGQHCVAHYVDGHCPHHVSEDGCGFLHGG